MSSVDSYIRSVFPNGTREGGRKEWREPPLAPTDMFAVTAGLLEMSGVYQFAFSRSGSGAAGQFCSPSQLKTLQQVGFAWSFELPFVTADEFDPAVAAAVVYEAIEGFPEKASGLQDLLKLKGGETRCEIEQQIRQMGGTGLFNLYGDAIRDRWRGLTRARADELVLDTEAIGDLPNWWTCAYELMAIADEAAFGAGLTSLHPDGSDRCETQVQREVLFHWTKGFRESEEVVFRTTTMLADPSIVCVQPKTRTPNVGCTLRSLSHNLAHLPGRGLASVEWIPSMTPPPSGNESFNALLVPYPFYISAKCFAHDLVDPAADWGEFHVRQRWLYDAELADRQGSKDFEIKSAELIEWIEGLAYQAQIDCGRLHAIIFPEYALDYATFDRLCKLLLDETKFPNLELVVSGLSNKLRRKPNNGGYEATERESGNYAAVCQYSKADANEVKGINYHFRGKHHRWKLDRRQIEKYALAHRLHPNKSWWESMTIEDRRIGVHEFRAGSTMSVLICEDLARADPCQRLVRSVGPNLVVALLMDGPQLKSRWPAHYAGVLADDPGSSVLTLTSMGLIGRAEAAGAPPSRTIALWKGHNTDARELSLPENRHGLVVTLTESRRTERTLDGREDGNTARVWSLSGSYPVKGPPLKPWMADPTR